MSEWRKITCEEREALIDSVGRSCNGPADPYGVFASYTDVEREIYTEWGNRNTEVPLLRDWRWPNSDRPCEHRAYVASPEAR